MSRPPAPPPCPRDARKRPGSAILIVCALAVLAVVWGVTPMARVFDATTLVAWQQQLRGWSFAPLLVIPAFVIGGLVAAPATLMIGATVLLFGAWSGVAYAFVGMLVSGSVVYAIGRHAARAMVDEWLAQRADSRLAVFDGLLARRGFVAVALMRLTPIPFSLQNVVIGASRITFRDYLLGTAIGILPVMALMAGVVTQFDAWLAHPAWTRLLALIATAVVVVAIAWMLRRWVARSARS
ncbi:MAG: VTT domain-containing protein [Burkholderiaceae bacterium]